MERGTVDAGGVRIGYLRAGSGTPVVLLHGGLGDARAWKRQLVTFAGQHDVLAWDAPGCGGSDDPPPDTSLADYADRLAAFVTALRLDRPHIVGLSFGGGLALATAARHPHLPRSVVAASAYAGWGGSPSVEEVRRRVAFAERACDEPPERWLPGFLESLYGSHGPDETAEAIAEIARSPPSVAEAIRARIARVRFRVVHGVGHALPFEAPERFDTEVSRFLAVSASSGAGAA